MTEDQKYVTEDQKYEIWVLATETQRLWRVLEARLASKIPMDPLKAEQAYDLLKIAEAQLAEVQAKLISAQTRIISG